ncbi:hypothetical protein PUNSTDRAFT_130654 [Punctularia strigosozonata HHB-11173 SS5]|uniref:uncharacterized protein n=1 Tax=Punctularia strigosozonata (strain HHB-11173) TaxID=741275 RepID=UPI0004417DB2|nr:uncharacterized protein PUNSTDRAFT_130654 [Punctularia strigosozonata HHB-11173 SS5]EIN12403.1 hypothetical protein PUNSTDRAFT_130654 [Punctularia strigosozonata HHB-11173 SS5]
MLSTLFVVDLRSQKEARAVDSRAPKLNRFRLRMPTLPKLPSSARGLRRLAMKLRGSRSDEVFDVKEVVLAQLHGLIDSGVYVDLYEVAHYYAGICGVEYYYLVIEELTKAGFF